MRIEKLIGDLPAHNRLFIPLTIGNHVDHQLVRRAAERAAAESRAVYYEEFPYTAKASNEDILSLGGRGWKEEVITVSKQAIAAKVEAISCYHSQISTFFDSTQDLNRQVRHYMSRTGGERYWLPSATTSIR